MPDRKAGGGAPRASMRVRGIRTGEQITPGFMPGAETGPAGWTAWVTGATPTALAAVFLCHAGLQEPRLRQSELELPDIRSRARWQAGERRLAATLNATDPNLKAFNARGGKLILYHGWNDAALPPRTPSTTTERGQDEGCASGTGLRAPVHGAGDAALQRWSRPGQLWPVRHERPVRSGARSDDGARTVGRLGVAPSQVITTKRQARMRHHRAPVRSARIH